MLHFLVLVCETLLTVSLLLGALMGFAWRRQLFEVRTPAKWGAILGLCTAAVLAGLKMGTGFIVRELYNIGVLAVMVPAEILLMALLVRSRNMSSEKAASPLMRLAFFATAACWTAYYLPDIFIYPSVFAVGVVQVASSDFIFIVCGYAAGIVLAILTCRAAYRVSAELPLRRLFPLCLALLLAFAAQQSVTVLQICVVRDYVPRSDFILDATIFLLNNAVFILAAISLLGAALAVLLRRHALATPIEGDNPAEKRKVLSLVRRRVRWSAGFLVLILLGFLVQTLGSWFDNRKVELSPPVAMEVKDGAIRIPLEMVSDGHLHRFVYTSKKGVKIRYIVIKKSATAYGVGLDACDVCGAGGGYYERKGQVVCILCDVVMNKATIGFAGGCNPVPLPFIVKDGVLVISTDDLEAEEGRFS